MDALLWICFPGEFMDEFPVSLNDVGLQIPVCDMHPTLQLATWHPYPSFLPNVALGELP